MGPLIFAIVVIFMIAIFLIWSSEEYQEKKYRDHEERVERMNRTVSEMISRRATNHEIKPVKVQEKAPSMSRVSSSRVLCDEKDLDLDPVADAVTDLVERVVFTNLVINNDSGGCDSPSYESNDSYSCGESSSCGSDISCGGCGGD